jgi:hypothetical protein
MAAEMLKFEPMGRAIEVDRAVGGRSVSSEKGEPPLVPCTVNFKKSKKRASTELQQYSSMARPLSAPNLIEYIFGC